MHVNIRGSEQLSMLKWDRFRGSWYLLSPPGSMLGPGNEGSAWRGQAEEGAGASVQPSAHRVPAHSLWDAYGRHQVQTLQTAQSHGQRSPQTLQRHKRYMHVLYNNSILEWSSAYPSYILHDGSKSFDHCCSFRSELGNKLDHRHFRF